MHGPKERLPEGAIANRKGSNKNEKGAAPEDQATLRKNSRHKTMPANKTPVDDPGADAGKRGQSEERRGVSMQRQKQPIYRLQRHIYASDSPSRRRKQSQGTVVASLTEVSNGAKKRITAQLLNGGNGMRLANRNDLYYHVGKCGGDSRVLEAYSKSGISIHKTSKKPDEIKAFESYQAIQLVCGCCFVSVPVRLIDEAQDAIWHLGERLDLSSAGWIELYLRERENMGDVRPFTSGGITLNDRAKIVNWMSYVCSKLGFQSAVYFLGVNFFDLYVQRSNKKVTTQDLGPIAATAFLVAANVLEVVNEHKLPTLREFVQAAQWLHSTSQILKLQMDMITVLAGSTRRAVATGAANQSLAGKTAYDFFVLYVSELKYNKKWQQVSSLSHASGLQLEIFHRSIALADAACQKGILLGVPSSVIVATTMVKTLSEHIKPLDKPEARRDFCREIFHLDYDRHMSAYATKINDLFAQMLSSPTWPVCGDDLGLNAPTVVQFQKRLQDPRQKAVDRLVRHTYRVFKSKA
eukprot:GHVU01226873.1.p1 GENE.GHVU01226873.1~~GHVU01226873.1.p1  ORF type:complete len:523 (+),score=105.36 GHVU01226873.1:708-2276(+)